MRDELVMVIADDDVVGPERVTRSENRLHAAVLRSTKLNESGLYLAGGVGGGLAFGARNEDGHVVGSTELPEFGLVVSTVGQDAFGLVDCVVVRSQPPELNMRFSPRLAAEIGRTAASAAG